MTEFKKGDQVKVTRLDATIEAFSKGSHMDEMIGKTYTVKSAEADEIEFVEDRRDYSWHKSDLELVRDHPKSARILTEKILIDGTPCRKILGFWGILGRDALPKKYLSKPPYFCMDDRYLNAYYPKNGDNTYAIGFCIGSDFAETDFQELLVWLKRAGSRLAKIRQQERDAWSGKETIEI